MILEIPVVSSTALIILFLVATVCSRVVILSPWDIPKTRPIILKTKKITIKIPKTRDIVVIFLSDFRAIALGSVLGSIGWGSSFSGIGGIAGLVLAWKSKWVGETIGTFKKGWGAFKSLVLFSELVFLACAAARLAALAIARSASWLLEFGLPELAAWEKPLSPNGLLETVEKGSWEVVTKVLFVASVVADWVFADDVPPPKVTPPIVVELLFEKVFFSWSM